MQLLVLASALLAILVLTIVFAIRSRDSDSDSQIIFPSATPARPVLVSRQDDDVFEAAFKQIFAAKLEHWFYSKVAGASFLNPDGSNRAKIIQTCTALEILELAREPDNPVDPRAISIRKLDTGKQLGYVEGRTAHEIWKDFDDPDAKWIAVFRRINRHPETGMTAGAVIILGKIVAN